MYRTLVFGMAAALILAGKASAQTTLPISHDAGTTTASLYEQLSPGNQKIADSLFEAQQGGDAAASWSVDDIALAKKKGTGWGNIFRRMKEDGLVPEKSLGQIISGRGNTGPGNGLRTGLGKRTAVRAIRPIRSNVIVTTADGKRVIYGLAKPRQSARVSAKARDGRAVKSHRVKTMARTSRPTVSMTARRAVVATRQSARLGRIARGAGRKARKAR